MSSSGDRRRVLIVDDEEALAWSLSTRLEKVRPGCNGRHRLRRRDGAREAPRRRHAPSGGRRPDARNERDRSRPRRASHEQGAPRDRHDGVPDTGSRSARQELLGDPVPGETIRVRALPQPRRSVSRTRPRRLFRRDLGADLARHRPALRPLGHDGRAQHQPWRRRRPVVVRARGDSARPNRHPKRRGRVLRNHDVERRSVFDEARRHASRAIRDGQLAGAAHGELSADRRTRPSASPDGRAHVGARLDPVAARARRGGSDGGFHG